VAQAVQPGSASGHDSGESQPAEPGFLVTLYTTRRLRNCATTGGLLPHLCDPRICEELGELRMHHSLLCDGELDNQQTVGKDTHRTSGNRAESAPATP
jgi:hypothetical protein